MSSGQQSVASFDPGRYSDFSTYELLQASARGWAGVDRRLLRSILDRGDAAVSDLLRFARQPEVEARVDIVPLLVDLIRHFRPAEGLPFLIDLIRQDPAEVDDELVESILTYGDRALEPLLGLYDELEEDEAAEAAFLLAKLRVRDPRVLERLLDRLEYDTADGAFALGIYGDPESREALEKILTEIPAEDVELRREVERAIEHLGVEESESASAPFDIYREYREKSLPAVDSLDQAERVELLSSTDPQIRAAAAHSFFNSEYSLKARGVMIEHAKGDADAKVRARCWEALGEIVAEQAEVREAMLAVLKNPEAPVEERGGAAVGLYSIAGDTDVRPAIEALYLIEGHARAKALEAMWRSLDAAYAGFFAQNLEDKNREILSHALRGAGYFRLTRESERIAKHLSSESSAIRDDALFAYALTVPGETTRGRVRGLLRKVDERAEGLTEDELLLVEFGLDERLRLAGLKPVFDKREQTEEPAESATPAPAPGRNDPCPCGSGKKYKKCCGK